MITQWPSDKFRCVFTGSALDKVEDTSTRQLTKIKGKIVQCDISGNLDKTHTIMLENCFISDEFFALQEINNARGVITGDKVNVRYLPKTSAKVVAQFRKGQEVTIKSQSGDWFFVETDSKTHG